MSIGKLQVFVCHVHKFCTLTSRVELRYFELSGETKNSAKSREFETVNNYRANLREMILSSK